MQPLYNKRAKWHHSKQKKKNWEQGIFQPIEMPGAITENNPACKQICFEHFLVKEREQDPQSFLPEGQSLQMWTKSNIMLGQQYRYNSRISWNKLLMYFFLNLVVPMLTDWIQPLCT